MAGPVAAVVLDALAAPRDEALRAALGPELDDELRRVLRERAAAWTRAAAGDGPALSAREPAELEGLLAGHDGPVLLVAPDVPGLGAHHLEAALDDLDAGVSLAFAPSADGSPFLLVLARPDPEVLARAGRPFEALTEAATAAGGTFGMLRAERRLASVADALAVRADPVAPPEVRDLLPAGLGGG